MADNYPFYSTLFVRFIGFLLENANTLLFTDSGLVPAVDLDVKLVRTLCRVYVATDGLLACLAEFDAELNKTVRIDSASASSSTLASRSASASLSRSSLQLGGSQEPRGTLALLPSLKASLSELLGPHQSYSSLFHDATTNRLVRDALSKIHSALLLCQDTPARLPVASSWLARLLTPVTSLWREGAEGTTGLPGLFRRTDKVALLGDIEAALLTMFGLKLADITIDGVPLSQLHVWQVQQTQSVYASSGNPELRELVKSGRKKCTNLELVAEQHQKDGSSLSMRQRSREILFTKDLAQLQRPDFLFYSWELPWLARRLMLSSVLANELLQHEVLPWAEATWPQGSLVWQRLRRLRINLRPLGYVHLLFWETLLLLLLLLLLWHFGG